MNALVASEYCKLTPFQQEKYNEIYFSQSAGNMGSNILSDSACFKIIEWVQRLEEPAAPPTPVEPSEE